MYETVFNIVNLFVSFQLAKFYNIKMPGKTSLRDKLDEDVLDLSLMQMSEVPVTEIVSTVIILGYFLKLSFTECLM